MTKPAIVNKATHQGWRYAQRSRGRRLHLVEMFPDSTLAAIAVCGVSAKDRWGMSINLPLGHACIRCTRIMFGPKAAENTK